MDNNIINNDYSFDMINKDGIEVTCDTLGIVNQDEGDTLIIYTDYSLTEDGKLTLYVSKVIAQDDGYFLQDVDNYENIPAIQKAMQNIWNQ